MFNRIFRISLMVAIGAILVAAIGAATTAGIAAARGELAMGHEGGMQAMRRGDGSHGMGDQMGAEAGETMGHRGQHAEMRMGDAETMGPGASMGAGAEADVQASAPQWLMVARGLIRAVASVVPLALIVAGISWVLHRTNASGPELAA
ncbi:hypothetical protein EMGBD1_01490 [Anaerolineaceae bacterium]|nr:hypothetical protein EMGBD1_01490 [Anaerolineaceae bacterium]